MKMWQNQLNTCLNHFTLPTYLGIVGEKHSKVHNKSNMRKVNKNLFFFVGEQTARGMHIGLGKGTEKSSTEPVDSCENMIVRTCIYQTITLCVSESFLKKISFFFPKLFGEMYIDWYVVNFKMWKHCRIVEIAKTRAETEKEMKELQKMV